MKWQIKPFSDGQFSEISSWWVNQNEPSPTPGMMVEDGTFVLYLNDVPALCLSVFLTQSKEIAYVQAFVKNPTFKGINLEPLGHEIWQHCFNYARNKGYKRVLCFSKVDKLSKKYERFGMRKSVQGLDAFVHEFREEPCR